MMRSWTLPSMVLVIENVACLLCRSVCAGVLHVLVALLMG